MVDKEPGKESGVHAKLIDLKRMKRMEGIRKMQTVIPETPPKA
jgi:hypothetical protein